MTQSSYFKAFLTAQNTSAWSQCLKSTIWYKPEKSHAVLAVDFAFVDVGAQLRGEHPYAHMLGICEAEIIGFDPLAERLEERKRAEGTSPHLTLLPYAIADGRDHTLYINNDDATSSLFPLNEAHNARFNNHSQMRTLRTQLIRTRRLDDVLPAGPIDFLKLDVQGGELMVLKGAERCLNSTAVIHCEVEFSPIYAGQPLLPEVQRYLMMHNFELIDLLVSNRNHYLTPSGRTAQDRLIWADAVFFRETDNPEMQRAQALIAASVYEKPTLAEWLLLHSSSRLPQQV